MIELEQDIWGNKTKMFDFLTFLKQLILFYYLGSNDLHLWPQIM